MNSDKFSVRPASDSDVQAWLERNECAAPAGKGFAVLRLDSRERWQVWSWHSSEANARRSIRNAELRRPVR